MNLHIKTSTSRRFAVLFVIMIIFCVGSIRILATNGSRITLATSELCNNDTRYYCRPGHHENKVNQKLLSLKRAGYKITEHHIKEIARQTRYNDSTKLPQ
jgi:hypothetical protein